MDSYMTAIFDTSFCVKTANVNFFDTFGAKIRGSFIEYVCEADRERVQNAFANIKNMGDYCGVAHFYDKNHTESFMLMHLKSKRNIEEELIDARFISIPKFDEQYTEIIERDNILRRHITNMELICFEYCVQTKRFVVSCNVLEQRDIMFSGQFEDWKKYIHDTERVKGAALDTFEALCKDIENVRERFSYHLTSSVFTNGESIEEDIINGSSVEIAYGNTYVVGTVTRVVNGITLGVENSYVRALKDPMTGVMNKASIIRTIKARIENMKKGESIVVAILDLDNFKYINDTYGHMYGDKTIIKFSEIISHTIDGRGVVGRFGGDEFMIMLEGIKNEQDLRSILRSIRSNVKMEFMEVDENIQLTTSIGTASYPEDADSYDDLFKKADYCLYLAKQRGKNRYVMFEGMMRSAAYLEDVSELKKQTLSLDKFGFMSNVIDILLRRENVQMSELLDAIGERFELDRISVYAGSDIELIHNWGKATPNRNFNCIYEDNYLDRFTEGKKLVINYMSNIKTAYPGVYEVMCKSGTEAAVQCLMGDKHHVDGFVSFEKTQNSTQWSDDEVYNMVIIAYLIEATLFNTNK